VPDVRWDPRRYSAYADERGRPFADLVTRIGHPAPRRVVDLGCGTGTLTATLADRWPDAIVEGIDSSPVMIDEARALAGGTLSFRVGDITAWRMPADTDVLVSNAALQWVPGHRELMAGWVAALPAGGWLAIQVPGNFEALSHTLMRGLACSARWAAQLGAVLRHHDAVAEPAEYAEMLLDTGGPGLAVEAWETTYVHVLPGDDPVLEWVRGTGLRPILHALSPDEAAEFEGDYGAALRAAYPRTRHGTLMPFRRVFVVAHRPRAGAD
jgi:trans-aconitate 2-methyltransferase